MDDSGMDWKPTTPPPAQSLYPKKYIPGGWFETPVAQEPRFLKREPEKTSWGATKRLCHGLWYATNTIAGWVATGTYVAAVKPVYVIVQEVRRRQSRETTRQTVRLRTQRSRPSLTQSPFNRALEGRETSHKTIDDKKRRNLAQDRSLPKRAEAAEGTPQPGPFGRSIAARGANHNLHQNKTNKTSPARGREDLSQEKISGRFERPQSATSTVEGYTRSILQKRKSEEELLDNRKHKTNTTSVKTSSKLVEEILQDYSEVRNPDPTTPTPVRVSPPIKRGTAGRYRTPISRFLPSISRVVERPNNIAYSVHKPAIKQHTAHSNIRPHPITPPPSSSSSAARQLHLEVAMASSGESSDEDTKPQRSLELSPVPQKNEEQNIKNEEQSIKNEEQSIKNEEQSIKNEEQSIKNEALKAETHIVEEPHLKVEEHQAETSITREPEAEVNVTDPPAQLSHGVDELSTPMKKLDIGDTVKASPHSVEKTTRVTRAAKRKAQEAQEALLYEIAPLTNEVEQTVIRAVKKGHGKYPASSLARVVPLGSTSATGNWLNDDVIDGYLQLVAEHGRRNDAKSINTPSHHSFTPFFWTKLSSEGPDSVKRWSKRAKIGGINLLSCDKVFIPINSGMHWTLCVVLPKVKKITYYNSMRGSGRHHIGIVKNWVNFELGSAFKEDEWTFEDHGESPQQTNMDDCGVFAITSARQIMLGLTPMSYKASQIQLQRKRIVAELVAGKLLKKD